MKPTHTYVYREYRIRAHFVIAAWVFSFKKWNNKQEIRVTHFVLSCVRTHLNGMLASFVLGCFQCLVASLHGSIAMPVTTRAGCTCDLTGVSSRTVRTRRRASMSADETVVPINQTHKE